MHTYEVRVFGADVRILVEERLDEVGLAEHVDKYPDQLSGGQKQRVGIARALVGHPRIILADEPTASLDKQSGRDVVELIQRLARENGAAVILVTHDNRILDAADRIIHLEDGRIRTMREAIAANNTRMLRLLDRYEPGAGRYLAALSLSLARVAIADRVVHDDEHAEKERGEKHGDEHGDEHGDDNHALGAATGVIGGGLLFAGHLLNLKASRRRREENGS